MYVCMYVCMDVHMYVCIFVFMYACMYVCSSFNMGTSDLDTYAQGPQAYISGKSRMPMLQLICNTFLASCAQAKSSVLVELQQLYL